MNSLKLRRPKVDLSRRSQAKFPRLHPTKSGFGEAKVDPEGFENRRLGGALYHSSGGR
ncbi:MAG: hypothetical protein UR63_C0022G0016 [Candidatus Roizmanbacteria bacterium GW2011_GWC2_35_12]|uniref:Uncharacterized protein n=1 Tax=Candidatus Roizmanbacteria bacterium GW2011_GWC2_35_12 TaxID=1618485 RepID=A0A0G0EIG9_9BACT|nr:MAG: hypothetical protein UR63_C0022G0016 [Candidatus Roizmanbacteria bacterium GW2011_GWC2_35_12]